MLRNLVRLGLLVFVVASVSTNASAEARKRELFDKSWQFALGHPSDTAKDFGHATGYFSYLAKTGFGDGPASPKFDAKDWRVLNLPHDWAIEVPFHWNASASHGYRTVGPRHPENSVGWYRKTFKVDAGDLGKRFVIEFDGIYRDAKVFVNGFFVGTEPSGYLDAAYDITDYLNYGGDNLVAVRVDATLEEGWYYEGAGIYRHTWLTVTDPVHVNRHGIDVRTEVRENHALVSVSTEVANAGRAEEQVSVTQLLYSPDGQEVSRSTSVPVASQPGVISQVPATLKVPSPRLWSLEDPALYRLVTRLETANRVLDEVSTNVGIRTLRFDPNHGFFLNGKHVKLKGTNNHQDHAGIGVALPDAVQEFRIRALKSFGSNAYRASHHPPTPELLDACDRLGMLVIDENRLQGSNPWHLSQVEKMIRRDRNHPSVIIWSLGNEEWGIEGNIYGERITRTMQDFARRLDPTRPFTVAISGGWGGTNKSIEAIGVNYIKQGDPDKEHAQRPEAILLGTEETTTQGTRGIYFDDRDRCHLAEVEDGSSGGNAEKGWKYYDAREYTAGVFYWTGFDYRGEATPFGYPAISSQFGILDTCGFPKDAAYYLQAWWKDEPLVHVYPHWNWPGREGQEIEVKVNSNADEVELFQDGKSLGKKALEKNGHLRWKVTYKPGRLVAKGYKAGKAWAEGSVETTGKAASLALAPDRLTAKADGRDVIVVTVSTKDLQGRHVPDANVPVKFSLSGPGRILGVGNGDPSCLEADTAVDISGKVGEWKRSTFQGLAQILIQTDEKPGSLTLTATSEGLTSTTLSLEAK